LAVKPASRDVAWENTPADPIPPAPSAKAAPAGPIAVVSSEAEPAPAPIARNVRGGSDEDRRHLEFDPTQLDGEPTAPPGLYYDAPKRPTFDRCYEPVGTPEQFERCLREEKARARPVPVEKRPPDVSGIWVGTLYQPGGRDKVFRFEMSVVQVGPDVAGESWIATGSDHGLMALAGRFERGLLTFRELRFVENVHGAGWYWCIKSGTLAFQDGSPARLKGRWTAPACAPGTIVLQRLSQGGPPGPPPGPR
jgi:hypothetical protein